MSFLENPFAEEEEEVVPDTPFGNYDVAQRENKYNALILSESTLGSRRREVAEGHLAELHTLVDRNTNLRKRLNDLDEIPTLGDPPARSFASDAPQAILATLQRRLHEGEAVIARGEDSIEFGAAIPSDRPPHSSRGEAGEDLLPLLAGSASESCEEGDEEAAPLAFDATRLQHWVEVLTEDIHQTRVEGVKIAEDDLLYAFIDYIRSELQQYMELRTNLHAQEASIQHKMGVLGRLKREGAVRLAKLAAEATVRSPFFSSEHALAVLANKDLAEETKRLEVVVALLLRNESVKQKALEYNQVVRRCRAEQHQMELRRENDEIGREVLFLRRLLSSSDTTEDGAASSEEQTTDCPLAEPTTTEKMHRFNTSIISRIRRVEEMLKSPDSAESADNVSGGSEDVFHSLSDTLTEIHVRTLERVVQLQNSCLRVFTALNADLEVRAARASLLMQLVLHNVGFENRMVEAVLDVPSQDLSAFPSEVSDYFTDNNEEFFSQFQAELESIVSAAKRQLSRQVALGDKVRHLALQQLPQGLAEISLHGDLGVAITSPPGPVPRIVLEENIQKSMDAELAAASDAEDRLVGDISTALEEWRSDLAKKLGWDDKQNHTESLRLLYTLEKQNRSLEKCLHIEREALESERAAEPDLALLESRLENIQLEVRALEAEEEALLEQISAFQSVHAA
ncbi:unnamed protein product [Phytomonas sp. EM1]|nr:unnamed protein product [Phytomonas sp. EM1]|eukprot:CCW59746.1 unnamed protein product [Phytomonas sp. isolate EM1]